MLSLGIPTFWERASAFVSMLITGVTGKSCDLSTFNFGSGAIDLNLHPKLEFNQKNQLLLWLLYLHQRAEALPRVAVISG